MAPENWCMQVGDRVYGPYSTEKMLELAEQKRVAYHSMVAPAGSRDFRPALQFPELRPLFGGQGQAADTPQKETATHLILFGDAADSVVKAGELLGDLPQARALTATAYLVKASLSAEDIRDQLAQVLPSTERAIVVTLSGAHAASHGVGLTEHEDIRALLPSA